MVILGQECHNWVALAGFVVLIAIHQDMLVPPARRLSLTTYTNQSN